jgi:phytoene desaturase (3,4-didehydrolycopene-forming)
LGVEYRLSTPISNITLSKNGRRATGVQLANGDSLTADIVICNADLIYAYNNLLPTTTYAKSLSERQTSCSSLSFYWALSRTVPELQAHNIFLAEEYQNSFDSIFKDHLIPKDPSFYVNVPSRVDPSAAPPNCDAVVVLVPVGHLLSDDKTTHQGMSSTTEKTVQDWPALLATARKQVIKTIKARTGVDIEPLIIHEQTNDPLSWKESFNLDRGAILGLSHSFFNVLSFRPNTKHASIKGLYFVGASTHPGTGVPICLAGGKIVASQILKDARMVIPWNDKMQVTKKTGKEIDKLHVRWSLFDWLIGALIGVVLLFLWFWLYKQAMWLDSLAFAPIPWGDDYLGNEFPFVEEL